MNPQLLAAVGRCERATLVFDLATIERTMQRVAAAACAVGIVPLFALKSFPHPRVRELAAQYLDGFDVASLGELHQAPAAKILSIVDPTGAAIAHASTSSRVIVGVETVAQLRAEGLVLRRPALDLGLRLLDALHTGVGRFEPLFGGPVLARRGAGLRCEIARSMFEHAGAHSLSVPAPQDLSDLPADGVRERTAHVLVEGVAGVGVSGLVLCHP